MGKVLDVRKSKSRLSSQNEGPHKKENGEEDHQYPWDHSEDVTNFSRWNWRDCTISYGYWQKQRCEQLSVKETDTNAHKPLKSPERRIPLCSLWAVEEETVMQQWVWQRHQHSSQETCRRRSEWEHKNRQMHCKAALRQCRKGGSAEAPMTAAAPYHCST